MKSLAFLLPLIVPAAVSAMAAAACLALGASAGEVRVFPRLPDGTLPDTEVATNVALNVQHDGNMRFSISIRFHKPRWQHDYVSMVIAKRI